MQEYSDEQGRTETVGGVYWPLLSVWTSDCRMIFDSSDNCCTPGSQPSRRLDDSVISAGLLMMPMEMVNVGERGLELPIRNTKLLNMNWVMILSVAT